MVSSKLFASSPRLALVIAVAAAVVASTAFAGAGSRARAISADAQESCAITSAGGVECWGSNDTGQLGRRGHVNSRVPVAVRGLGSGVKAITVGDDHVCALTRAATVRCWGGNGEGQLGNGTRKNSLVPVAVRGLKGAKAISAGDWNTCALKATVILCWGRNDYGQIGDGTHKRRLTPVAVVGLSRAKAIAVGTALTCAVTKAGAAKCWGGNVYGELGNGTQQGSSRPVGVVGLSRGVKAIDAGLNHACAITSSGGLKCWGNDFDGQLGDGKYVNNSKPVAVIGLSRGVKAVVVGGTHTCALTSGGGVKCWGDNFSGQLGNGTRKGSARPVAVSGLRRGVDAIAAGASHSCALARGIVKCWGNNADGELGNGGRKDRPTPVVVSPFG